MKNYHIYKKDGYLSLDTETNIPYEEVQIPLTGKKNAGKYKTVRIKTVLESSWKDPNNDIYTFIYADHPDRVHVLHSKSGFKRKLPFRIINKLKTAHTIIGANLKFDLGYIWHDPNFQQWLKKGGKIWDVQLAAYLLSAQRWLYPSLAEMEKYYLGIKTKVNAISGLFKRLIGPQEIINRRKERRLWWKAYTHYCPNDGRTPMLIMKKQYKEAKARGMLPIIELYNKYLLFLTMMEVNGLVVDIPNTEKLFREYSLEKIRYLELATNMVKELWQDPRLPELNLNSDHHLSAILFGGDIKYTYVKGTGEFVKTKNSPNYGKEKTKKTEGTIRVDGFGIDTRLSTETKKKGVYQTSKDVIERIYKHSKNEKAKEYCGYIKESHKYDHMISTYLNALLFKSVDGIVRPNFNNTAVVTSRLSCSAPNAQNFPAHGEFGEVIPKLLVAPEGWSCVNIDFSQLETFNRAQVTEDPTLIADLESGKCFHTQNMAWGYGLTYEEGYKLAKIDKVPEWDEKRAGAKAVTFGEAYGQMPESMAERTGWDKSIIEKIYANMYETYPMLQEWDKRVAMEVEKSSKICTKDGVSEKYSKEGSTKGIPRRFHNGIELLPIRQRDRKSYKFDYNEYRHIGYYRAITGMVLSFQEFGSVKKDDTIYRYYKPTQMKNYPMQSLAGNCQAITSVEMFQLLLRHPDKVKIVNEVHDSKWFLIKNEYISRILPKLCSIMENTSQLLQRDFGIPILVNFRVEAKIGKNFSEMEPFDHRINYE
jgi:DNA polymerase I-like protein with 3'-5' exonuclease and polymerase domains